MDLGQSHLLVMGLEKGAGKPLLTHFFLRERPTPSSPETLSDELRAIFKAGDLNPRKVRVAIKGQGVVIRNITFPKMKREEFVGAIGYEIEKYIPFKSSETLFDFQIVREDTAKKDADEMRVLLVAIKQPEIYQLLRIFQNADLQIELVDISAFSFANSIQFLCPEMEQLTSGFLDMGAESSTFGILARGEPIFIRDIPFGGIDMLRIIKRKINLEEAGAMGMLNDASKWTSEFREAMESGLATFVKELKLSLGYYLDRVSGAEPIEKLYLMGRGARFLKNSDFLEKETKIMVHRPDILSKIDLSSFLDGSLVQQNEDLLPIALGLCLRP